ncbi:MAG TPA: SDR family NAD(P)-dependent oxidoreductase [Nitrososphaeria archaeon]|nr:SDR family NAD(P)-dependent oxidoreductase [Nitrososphaeria archaeon]
MRALVTGGAGFIGGHLVEKLVERDWDVIVFDNFERASLETLRTLPSEAELRRIDIRDLEAMKRYAGDVDVIFHLAALTDVVESEVKKDEYWNVNVMGTENVLKIAKDVDAKLIFTSSAAVYGELNNVAREDLKPNPISFYGITKLECEKLCMRYYEEYGADIVVLRLFNVFGERARGGVVKIFLERAKEGKPLIIYGDGEAVRDFIYVGDVVDALIKAALSEKASGRILNVGSGKPTKVKELAEVVAKETGVKIIYESERKGEIKFSLADISLAKKLLNWNPKIYLIDWLRSSLRSR